MQMAGLCEIWARTPLPSSHPGADGVDAGEGRGCQAQQQAHLSGAYLQHGHSWGQMVVKEV